MLLSKEEVEVITLGGFVLNTEDLVLKKLIITGFLVELF